MDGKTALYHEMLFSEYKVTFVGFRDPSWIQRGTTSFDLLVIL